MGKEILEDLKIKIKGDVVYDEETLTKYSVCTSLFEVRPTAVVYPKNVLDIENIVHFVNDNVYQNKWLSITARSAGSCMSGGSIGEGLILDFTKYLNKFEIDVKKQKSISMPGVFYRDFEKETLINNLIMPVFPASKDLAAIGGMVANNCGGEKSLKYGQIRNFAKRLKVVLSNGFEYEFRKIPVAEVLEKAKEDSFIGGIYKNVFELIEQNYDLIQSAKPKTLKNSSGYALWDVYNKEEQTFDLTQLFTGSQGTLGIITESELDLVKTKKYKKLITVFLKNWDTLPNLVNKIRIIEPETMETFDNTTLMLGLRFFPQIAKKAKISLMKFVFGFWPEFLIGIKFLGLPKLILLVEIEESEKEVLDKKVKDLEQILNTEKITHRVLHNERETEKYFVVRRESFSLLREKVKNKQTVPFIDDFCVSPEKLPEFLPKFLAILKKYKISANIAGHAGEGNLHIIPLMNLHDNREREKIMPCADEVYSLIIEFGGTITAEHNDGIIRTPYVEQMFGVEVYKLFKDIKKIFDPKNIFNPGKKVGGTKEFSSQHIKNH
jgi:FAD/FMN-containing dehydrogenase